MLADLRAVTEAFFLLALLVLVPGFATGWLTNTLDFRKQPFAIQTLLATPLSISICPILTYLIWRWTTIRGVWLFYGALWLCFLIVLLRTLRTSRVPVPDKHQRWFLIGIMVWSVLATASLIDIQTGHRLYPSVVSYDYTVRSAFTSAISRTGVPPQNPFFYPGHPAPLRYHYFWLLICSLADQLGGASVDARQAMLAGTVWSGIGLICLIPLYLLFYCAQGAVNLWRRTSIGIALLMVTGLDILPVLLWILLSKGFVSPEMEWWNEQVTSWVGSMLWVPHHVAGLIACLMGWLVLWNAPAQPRNSRFLGATVIAGLAFATAAGSSIYIAFVFAAFGAVWAVVIISRRWYRELSGLLCAGIVALVAAIPYLASLTAGGAGGSFAHLTIRRFGPATGLLHVLHLDHPGIVGIMNLLFLPLNYFLELGFFFVIGLWRWRAWRSSGRPLRREELGGWVMLLVSVTLCTFLRSGVIDNNDLGWRGFLFAQFVLLLWAVEHLDNGKRLRTIGRPLSLLLILGVAGTVYETGLLRLFPLLSDAGIVRSAEWLSADRQLGERTYAVRRIYSQLRNTLPGTAIVQHNPDTAFDDLYFGLYSDRQTVGGMRDCGAVFGGDPASCRPIISPLAKLFSHPEPADFEAVKTVCRSRSIDALLVKDTDPIWADTTSWVWKAHPTFENRFARAFLCRPGDYAGISPADER